MSERADTTVLYAGHFLVGLGAAILGPLIPAMAPSWGMAPEAAGSLFVAQFSVSAVGAAVSGLRLRLSLFGGYAALALGLGLLAAGTWTLAPWGAALVGLAMGLAAPAANLVVAARHAGRRGAALAILNLMFGMGAFACPLLFAAVRGRLPATTVPAVMAGIAVLVVGGLAWTVRRRETVDGEKDGAAPDGAAPAILVWLGALMLLYVGVETAVAGWLVAYADQVGATRDAVSMLVGSGFWGALLATRALMPWLLRHLSERALYLAALGVGAVGVGILLLAPSRPVVALGAIVAGAGLAPLFPLNVSLISERAGGSPAVGLVFAATGLGAAVLPWLAGRLSTAAGELRHGYWVPLAGLVVLAVLFALQRPGPVTGPNTNRPDR